MRLRLGLTFAVLLALAVPASAGATVTVMKYRQVGMKQNRQAHRLIGSKRCGAKLFSTSFRAKCSHGRVTVLRHGSDQIAERGKNLFITWALQEAPKRAAARIANSQQSCTDNRGSYSITNPAPNGLPFNMYQFKVNTNSANPITWRAPGASLSNAGTRLIFEASAAAQDWQGFRNPSPDDGGPRDNGCGSGPPNGWPQTASPVDNWSNVGNLNAKYLGVDNSRGASLNPACFVGNNFIQDGVNMIVAGDFPHTPFGNGYCDSHVAATTIVVNGSNYITEADTAVDIGSHNFCYRFTGACTSPAWLNANRDVFPVEDILRHEIGHALGLGHTCADDSDCSSNAMNAFLTPWMYWPQDVSKGDKNFEYLMYYNERPGGDGRLTARLRRSRGSPLPIPVASPAVTVIAVLLAVLVYWLVVVITSSTILGLVGAILVLFAGFGGGVRGRWR